MALAGGFGLRNTLIILAVFNILIVIMAAIINNLFPNILFADIITTYVNVFLSSVLLVLAGTVGFVEIVFNIVFSALWVVLNFLWSLLNLGEPSEFLKTVPSFDFSTLTTIFVDVFVQIIREPLVFSPSSHSSHAVSMATGGVIIGGFIPTGETEAKP